MKQEFAIHWFRQDLRIKDNPSLNYLSKKYKRIVAVYIYDEVNCDKKLGSASKIWLHHSLIYLNKKLQGNLVIYNGDPIKFFKLILHQYNVLEISWNRCYEPWVIKRDRFIKNNLKEEVKVNSFNASLLWEPWEILKQDGTPYKVFTPFYRKGCLNYKKPRIPYTRKFNFFDHQIKFSDISGLKLLTNKDWEKKIIKYWMIGESHAEESMHTFFSSGIKDYFEGRNFPIKKNVSKLSPYLHWGQISPNTLWYEALKNKNKSDSKNIDTFKSELGWREFSYNLLYHFPKIYSQNLQKKFNRFPWTKNNKFQISWEKGKTGYPIVDAGMRELWQTGYMHNRVRMIAGSFLVKNLLIDWNTGEKWFWDCLFDADLASNSASWQWVSGSGTDSSPYFRIFNPTTQAKKFDPNGEYIIKFIPELKEIPLKYLFSPWECPKNILNDINFKFGIDYPRPIVDLKLSRQKALSAFSSLKSY